VSFEWFKRQRGTEALLDGEIVYNLKVLVFYTRQALAWLAVLLVLQIIHFGCFLARLSMLCSLTRVSTIDLDLELTLGSLSSSKNI
jgi:hypothetical protein